MATTMTKTDHHDRRIEQLSTASARRVIEPDVEVQGRIGPGQIVADELLSIADLDLDLTPQQRARLSREEIASITSEGIRFEALLMAGFGLSLSRTTTLTDPRVTYLLHELGEETRHSRLFVRVLDQIQPTATSPFDRGIVGFFKRHIMQSVIHYPALFCVLVLAGEEIPDLIQKRTSEHPDTDPFLREVNRYHRQEEARHLAFARMLLPELWATSSRLNRFRVRRVAPFVINQMFAMLIHPGVYQAAGLPGWRTWRRAQRSQHVVGLRHEATRPILKALVEAGAVNPRSVPGGWRRLCGVDRAPDLLGGAGHVDVADAEVSDGIAHRALHRRRRPDRP